MPAGRHQHAGALVDEVRENLGQASPRLLIEVTPLAAMLRDARRFADPHASARILGLRLGFTTSGHLVGDFMLEHNQLLVRLRPDSAECLLLMMFAVASVALDRLGTYSRPAAWLATAEALVPAREIRRESRVDLLGQVRVPYWFLQVWGQAVRSYGSGLFRLEELNPENSRAEQLRLRELLSIADTGERVLRMKPL